MSETTRPSFTFNHTMLRVKDPQASLDFYVRVLGMTLLRSFDFPDMRFTAYFIAHGDEATMPTDAAERARWIFSQRGVIELIHNWGTEHDSAFRYHDGNAQPQGFGHICMSVPDLEAAVAWFDHCGVTFVKRPDEGRMRDLAFVKDPDGYWIEVVQPTRLTALPIR